MWSPTRQSGIFLLLSGQALPNYSKNRRISTNTNRFYAHGKLLLSGEYFVLDGAKALAIPTRYGQEMVVNPSDNQEATLAWESFDNKDGRWFHGIFSLDQFTVKYTDDPGKADQILKILSKTKELNPGFLNRKISLHIKTRLEFPLEWGLGSSSTLVYNISQWAQVDPFELLFSTLEGSGYDVACAQTKKPILYQLTDNKAHWIEVDFYPPFSDDLYFIYLGKKQSSKEGIKLYRKNAMINSNLIDQISKISEDLLKITSLADFEVLLKKHEELVASTLKLSRAKDIYFADFWGEVKSLGAWGGDFVLATSDKSREETVKYFKDRQFPVVISFKDLIFEPAKQTEG